MCVDEAHFGGLGNKPHVGRSHAEVKTPETRLTHRHLQTKSNFQLMIKPDCSRNPLRLTNLLTALRNDEVWEVNTATVWAGSYCADSGSR